MEAPLAERLSPSPPCFVCTSHVPCTMYHVRSMGTMRIHLCHAGSIKNTYLRRESCLAVHNTIPPRIVCLRAGGGGRFVVIAATSCCTYYAATPLLHSASLRCSNKICPSALLAPLLCCYSLVLPLSLVLR